jgi:outer membrane lipoprotein-sorting protein
VFRNSFPEVAMLKTGGLLGCVSLLVLAPALHADDAADAKAVVDKAIKAMGGADKLAKTPATTFKCKATVDDGAKKGEFSGTWSIQLPDKYRAELELVFDGRTQTVTLVINGDKGWANEAGRNKTEDAPEDAMKIIKADFGAIHLAHTLVPLTGKEYKLSSLAEVKVNDKAAVGVKVERKDLPDVDLYFDKETHLPVKAEVRVKERGGEEMLHTFLFQDYKEDDGLKHFTKLTLHRADKEAMVMELSEGKRLEKLEANLFEKP